MLALRFYNNMFGGLDAVNMADVENPSFREGVFYGGKCKISIPTSDGAHKEREEPSFRLDPGLDSKDVVESFMIRQSAILLKTGNTIYLIEDIPHNLVKECSRYYSTPMDPSYVRKVLQLITT